MDKYNKYLMYEMSVQCVAADLDFAASAYRRCFGRLPQTVREDFCGTAAACCEWVRRHPDNKAWGVDLDTEVLAWALHHNVAALGHDEQTRVKLLQDDVRFVDVPPVDVTLAMNFSYFLFKTRETLRAYFLAARQALANQGMLVLDVFGGHEAFRPLKESRQCDGFTYVWEQAAFDPISHDMLCHIHFERDDGSQVSPAFSYDWRLWTLPEITELLTEAGFGQIQVYWEGVDSETGEGNGHYEPATCGTPDPAWISYVTAVV